LALEGPTLTWTDPLRTESESRPSARLGFDGKLLIHPAQIAPARKAFCPSPEDVARATRIVEVASVQMPAVINGMMIDEPMLVSARRVLYRARACES
jgi:citrate lyase subunit beta/citryl-CoA lyase